MLVGNTMGNLVINFAIISFKLSDNFSLFIFIQFERNPIDLFLLAYIVFYSYDFKLRICEVFKYQLPSFHIPFEIDSHRDNWIHSRNQKDILIRNFQIDFRNNGKWLLHLTVYLIIVFVLQRN